ncbi:MAG: M56 family metallopeptidase [Myroides sp.]|nr:M56 family metallopeptidase [Myroides sp.]
MVFYLVQVTVLWLVFSAIYYFVLSNKSMFRFNRWYLVATFIGSLIIPLIPLGKIFGTVPFQSISLPQTVVLLNELVIDVNNENVSQSFNWILWTKVLFGIGTIIFLFRFVKELVKLKRLYQQSEKEVYEGLVVCKIRQPHQVFSFGRMVFIDCKLFDTINKNQTIWIHEKTHILQGHSADVLVVELCKIFFWFHPLVYLYERHIKMNHEYLADEAVLKQTNDVKAYQYKLLDYLENTNSSLASTFNFKLTQKRFMMMKNQTNPAIKMLTKVFVAFGIIATITFVACNNVDVEESTENIESKKEEKLFNFVEQKALPKEGIQNFYQNFARSFNTPEGALNPEDKEIAVRLKFIVEKDGRLSGIHSVGNNVNPLLADEAIRVLKSMPAWTPAQHEGEIVRSTFTLPIKIRVNQ